TIPETVIDQALNAPHRLIGGLKQESDAAREMGAATGEDTGYRSDDGGVNVVAAAMIPAGVDRGVGGAGGFFHVDSVHVGADQDRWAGAGAFEQAEDPGATNAFSYGKTETAQVRG